MFKICKLKVTHKRRWYVLACILLVVFAIILALTPIENIFITFPSAEAAFEYSSNMRNSTPLVVEGQDSAFVIAKKTDVQDVYSFVKKGQYGWKLCGIFDAKIVFQAIDNGVMVDVYRYKNTTDYYISVSNINGDKSIVQDNYNSKFYVFSDKDFYTYYAYVSNLCQDYILTVNNKEISIMK